MDEVKVNELPIKSNLALLDRVVLEDEDGTKTTTLSSVQLLLSKAEVYNTYADLKTGILNAVVVPGMLCTTLGYHYINDNGGGIYLISTDTSLEDSNDIIDTIESNGVTYTIQLIVANDECITPEQLGAYGDGKTDDTKAIKKALSSEHKIRFKSNATYKMTESINIESDISIDFNNTTLAFHACDGFIMANSLKYVVIRNLNIDASSTLTCFNFDKSIDRLILENVCVNNYSSNAIIMNEVISARISNSQLYSNASAQSVPVAIIYGTDQDIEISEAANRASLYFDNLVIQNAYPAFYIKNCQATNITMKYIKYTGNCDIGSSNLLKVVKGAANNYIHIGSVHVENASCMVYTNSPAIVEIDKCMASNCMNIIDQISEDSTIIITGESLITAPIADDQKVIYKHISGTIRYNGALNYDTNYRLFVDTDDITTFYNGKLFDIVLPGYREEYDHNGRYVDIIDETTLLVKCDRNVSFFIESDDCIKKIHKIKGVLEGQSIKLYSERLIEIDNTHVLALSNPNKRVFIGTGSRDVEDDTYAVDMGDAIIESSFGKNIQKKLRLFIKPLTDNTMNVYMQFVDSDGSGFGSVRENSKSEFTLTIDKSGVLENVSSTSIMKLDDIIWSDSDEANVKVSQKYELLRAVNVNDIDTISVTVNCDNLYLNDNTQLGLANTSLYPKHIFGNFVFYPAGITLRKTNRQRWYQV